MSRKKWFVLVLFLVETMFFCVSSLWAKYVPSQTGSGSFFAVSVTPQGELSSRVTYPSIQIVFSEAVVPIEKLGEPILKSEHVEITPPLEGVFRWYGTSTLSFDCSQALIPQMVYTVKINKEILSVQGRTFSGKDEFSFYTEEIKLENVIPGYLSREEKNLDPNEIPPEYAKDVALVFSNRVNVNVISRYISVRNKSGRSYTFFSEQVDEKTLLLKFKNEFPKNEQITVTLSKGAQSDTGYRLTETEQKKSFHTLRPLELKNLDGSTTLRMVFNHQLLQGSEQEIFDALSFRPRMELDVSNVKVAGNTLIISDLPVAFMESYSFTLKARTIKDAFGQRYDKAISSKIIVKPEGAFASYRGGHFVFLESAYKPRLALEAQNLSDGKSSYTITPILGVSDDFVLLSEKTFELATSAKDKNKRSIKTVALSPFLEKTADGEFRGALKFSADFDYKSENGKDIKYTRTSYVQVTDLGISAQGAGGRIVVNVSSLKTAEPLGGVEVSLIELDRESMEKSSANSLDGFYEKAIRAEGTTRDFKTTDDNGIAVFDFEEGKEYCLLCKTNDDRAVLPVGFGGRGSEQRTQIITQSDVFRPEDTVEIKIIDRTLERGKYTTHKGKYIVRIVDRTYESQRRPRTVFAEFSGELSAQGTASAKWLVPKDAAPGDYFVEYERVIEKTENGDAENDAEAKSADTAKTVNASSETDEIAKADNTEESGTAESAKDEKIAEEEFIDLFELLAERIDEFGEVIEGERKEVPKAVVVIENDDSADEGDEADIEIEVADDEPVADTVAAYEVDAPREPYPETRRHARFSVQYFERLKFAVDANITPITYIRGDTVSAGVSASYLGGGAISASPVRAEWTRNPTRFESREKYSDYTFGPTLDWRSGREDENFEQATDATLGDDGNAHFSVLSGSEAKDGAPYSYNLQALVTDTSNQLIAARANAIVHPASFYIGISRSKIEPVFYRVKAGDEVEFKYITLTPEAEAVGAALYSSKNFSWTLNRTYWKNEPYTDEYGYQHTQWKELVELEASDELKAREGSLVVSPQNSGRYLLAISGEDSAGRKVVTEYSFYVSSDDWNDRPFYDDSYRIELSSDKQMYSVGDTAVVSLNSSLEKGTYIVTVASEGNLDYQVLRLNETTSTIEIPITENHVPRALVQVASYSSRTGEPAADYYSFDKNKPMDAVGEILLNVSNESRGFDIKMNFAQTTFNPGSEVRVELEASDNSKPLDAAELALIVVDKGVLNLTNYKITSPLDFFYDHSYVYMNKYGSRVFLMNPVTYMDYTIDARRNEMLFRGNVTASSKQYNAAMVEESEAVIVMDAFDDMAMEAGGALVVRNNFNATAAFIPSIVTDKNGKVAAVFKLPDTLTEYEVTVLGINNDKFAIATQSISASNTIAARDVQTKILRLGDVGEAGVVVTNSGAKDSEVTVSFEVTGGLELTQKADGASSKNGEAEAQGEVSKRLVVKAGKTERFMFDLLAKDYGWVTLAFKVNSSEVNEVIYKPLEIQKPYLYETVSTLGTVEGEGDTAIEKIKFPSLAEDGKGSLFLQLDSTRLGALRSAIDYVFNYPYGCLEQRASAIMPLVAFGKYIDAFNLESKLEVAPEEVVKQEFEQWAKLQKADGGFPYWKTSSETSFATSLRIAEIIALAKENGIEIPDSLDMQSLVSYLKNGYEKMKAEKNIFAQSYSLYVLSRLGEKMDKAVLNALVQNRNSSVHEIAYAALAALEANVPDAASFANQAVAKIKNTMALTTRGVVFQISSAHSWLFLGGEIEQYALSLHLFAKANPADVYVNRLVYEMLELQKANGGCYRSTAETSRALIALDAYIKTANLEDADFTAEILLGGGQVLSGEFKGIEANPVSAEFDFNSNEISSLERDTEIPIEVKKNGKGTLFYTISMKYALKANELKPRDEGLCVYTEILDARTGEKVEPTNLESGRIYRQKVFVTTTRERTFVALRAAVPAGAEILNAAFVTTATVPPQAAQTNGAKIVLPQISHQDIYDAEVRCFWDYLAPGTQSFEFLFRANRSGVYQTPSIIAECMYAPEVFGRSAGYEASIKQND